MNGVFCTCHQYWPAHEIYENCFDDIKQYRESDNVVKFTILIWFFFLIPALICWEKVKIILQPSQRLMFWMCESRHKAQSDAFTLDLVWCPTSAEMPHPSMDFLHLLIIFSQMCVVIISIVSIRPIIRWNNPITHSRRWINSNCSADRPCVVDFFSSNLSKTFRGMFSAAIDRPCESSSICEHSW